MLNKARRQLSETKAASEWLVLPLLSTRYYPLLMSSFKSVIILKRIAIVILFVFGAEPQWAASFKP